MFVPMWIIIANALLMFVLLTRALRTSAAPMIEAQRAATPTLAPAEAQRLMSLPEVQQAVAHGRKIEAIKHVRSASGMGLKDAKQLVERHWPA